MELTINLFRAHLGKVFSTKILVTLKWSTYDISTTSRATRRSRERSIVNSSTWKLSTPSRKTEGTCIKRRLGPKATPKYSHEVRLGSQETTGFFVPARFFQAGWRAWSSSSRSALLTELGGSSSILAAKSSILYFNPTESSMTAESNRQT